MSEVTETPADSASPGPSFPHKAANYAVLALGGGFLLNILMGPALSGVGAGASRIGSLVAGCIFISAMPAGIIALLGIRKHGRAGLLWKGLAGTLVPVLLTVMAIPAFLKVREVSRQKLLQNIAREMTQSSPKMIDEITRLDGAVVEAGNRLIVNETIVSMNADEIDRELWKKNAVPTLRAAFAQSSLVSVVKNGATVVYRYYGKDQKLIDEMVFEPKEFPKQ